MTVLAAALCAALPALARQTEEKKAVVPQVEIKGSADSYNPRKDDTASKIVVTHDEIVKFGDTNVLDTLKRLPGVTVSGAAGRPGGEIRMRGLGGGYTQILINGERAPAGFSMDALAPDVIERIEVLRAASAEFSTQSIAGTINIVLRKAISTQQREVKAGVVQGPGFRSPNLNIQLSDKMGKMSYSVAINAIHNHFDRESPLEDELTGADGSTLMKRETAQHESGSFSALNVAPRVNWNLEGGDTLTSQSFIHVNEFRRDAHTNEHTITGSASRFPDVEMDTDNKSHFLRTELNWVHKLQMGGKADLKLGANYGSNTSDTRRIGPVAVGQGLDTDIKGDSTDKGFTTQGKFSIPLMEGHSLAMGWDAGYSARDDQRRENGWIPQPRTGTIGETHTVQDFSAHASRVAVFGQDEWNVTPRLSLYLGARWEGLQTSTDGSDFAGATSRTGVWSPIVQTLFKLPGTKADQWRFALTRTFKAPRTEQLVPRRFTSVNNSPTEPDTMGNPNLKPETALGIDTSIEHYFGEGGLLSANVWTRRIDGYMRTAVVQGPDGLWVSMPINDGRADAHGLELEVKFPLKAVLDNAPPVDLRASVSRTWSHVASVPGPENRLDQQTPISGTFGVDYKVGALTTGASFVFKDAGSVRVSDTQSGYATVTRTLDLYALYKFDPKNQLRVTAFNVLRQDTYSDNIFTDAGGALRHRTIVPGVAFVRIAMEMKF